MTPMQKTVLKAIIESEFHDGAHPINNPTWTDCVQDDTGLPGAQFRAVAVGLQEAGFIRIDAPNRGENDGTIRITQAGWDAYHSA